MTSRLKHEVRDFLLQIHSSDFNPPGEGTIAPIAFSDPYGWNILENEKYEVKQLLLKVFYLPI